MSDAVLSGLQIVLGAGVAIYYLIWFLRRKRDLTTRTSKGADDSEPPASEAV